jgi:hypothetical protein
VPVSLRLACAPEIGAPFCRKKVGQSVETRPDVSGGAYFFLAAFLVVFFAATFFVAFFAAFFAFFAMCSS